MTEKLRLVRDWENLEKIKKDIVDRSSILIENQNKYFLKSLEQNFWNKPNALETDFQNMEAVIDEVNNTVSLLFVNYDISFYNLSEEIIYNLDSKIIVKAGASNTSTNMNDFIIREKPFFDEQRIYSIKYDTKNNFTLTLHHSLKISRACCEAFLLYYYKRYSQPPLPPLKSKLILQLFNPITLIT